MSLTSRLDDRKGPERRFVDSCFVGEPAELKRGLPATVREQLRTPEIAPPEGVTGSAFGTVGTAFDYRVRFSLEPLPAQPLAAHAGAALLVGSCGVTLQGGSTQRLKTRSLADRGLHLGPGTTQALVDELFGHMDSPQTLDEPAVARYCLVLALFEEVYRAWVAPGFDSPLFHLAAGTTLADLMAIPSDAQVAVRLLCAGA